MDFVGEFHKEEINGKPFLVYQNVMKPLPQIHTPTSKLAIHSGDDFLPQPLVLCPTSRKLKDWKFDEVIMESGILTKFEDDTSNGHHVLPLFWCNNKEVDPEVDLEVDLKVDPQVDPEVDSEVDPEVDLEVDSEVEPEVDAEVEPEVEECGDCRTQTIGADYYFCVKCDKRFHKECVESPLEISHPSHVKHSLQLYFSLLRSDRCFYCTETANGRIYYCALCDIYMHMLCAKEAIPFFIDQPKRHDHTLTLFPRQASLTCNICGLVNELYLTYICAICDFVTHSDCLHIPQTIRISRHSHRVSFTSSLPLGKWSCGVCRREIDSDYGAYSCNVCSDYAVHTRCALRKDIWDGIELEGVPEDEDVEPPFERIAEGIILHFSHGFHLEIKTYNGVYDEEKFCQACVLPIYEKNFYVCVECDFILHETCADAPCKKYHPLHPHPLEQKVTEGGFSCYACNRTSTGFGYECANQECKCILDVVCASVSEPFDYQGHHQHLLYLALDPKEKPKCDICKSTEILKVLNCIECDFIICFKCATLPYKVRYKHDEHYLTFCRGDEASGSDWCELCEGKLAVGGEEGFYKCNDCCTTLHINCLLGLDLYVKSGLTFRRGAGELLYQRNNSASRPICNRCKIRCPYPIYLEYRKKMSSTFHCNRFHIE